MATGKQMHENEEDEIEKEAKMKREKAAKKAAFERTFSIIVSMAAVFTALAFAFPGSAVVSVASRLGAAAFFVGGGLAHFDPNMNAFYIALMPPFLPSKESLHKLAGVCECLGGMGLVASLFGIEFLGNASAWFLMATLWAVFPANIYCALSAECQKKTDISAVASLIRLPIQLLFLAWIHSLTTDTFTNTISHFL
eukprot:scaffold23476_cov53-Attheya_sp.AAC.6